MHIEPWQLNKLLLDNFAQKAADYKMWARSAYRLLLSAKQIENKKLKLSKYNHRLSFYLEDIYFMLCGFAIENLLKAAIVKSNPQHIRDEAIRDKKLPKILNGHRLNILAQKASISFSVEQIELLQRIEDILVWAGRYPLPLKPELDQPELWTTAHNTSLLRIMDLSDFRETKKLINYIKKQIGINFRNHSSWRPNQSLKLTEITARDFAARHKFT